MKEYTVTLRVSGYVQIKVSAQDARDEDEAAAIAEDIFETMPAEEVASRSDLSGDVYLVLSPDAKTAYFV